MEEETLTELLSQTADSGREPESCVFSSSELVGRFCSGSPSQNPPAAGGVCGRDREEGAGGGELGSDTAVVPEQPQ